MTVYIRAFHGWWALACAIFLVLVYLPQWFEYKRDRQEAIEYQARLALWQADNYFVVRSVTIANTTMGQPIYMNVDREIKQPFVGSYSTFVREFPEGAQVCKASDSYIPYDPVHNLPEPLTLSWWANNGDCSFEDLMPGEFFVDTHWTLHSPDPDLPDRIVTHRSNPFTISAVSQEEATRAIQQQETVVDELNTLREQVKELQNEVRK